MLKNSGLLVSGINTVKKIQSKKNEKGIEMN